MASNAIVRLLFNTADFDKNIKRAKGEIGNFEKGITSMAGKIGPALSGFAAFAGISVAIGDAVRTSMEFEKSLSSLKSLTGVTTQELSYFKDEAIRLGSTTTQTASQVVDAFKLMGSQIPSLLQNKEALVQVTESAIVLAEAAEIDVPEAAKALAGSLNQMGASSSHAAEYINILAAASQQGSADIPYLNKAIENAGGAASSVGVQFNELVAAIEAIAPKITDAGSAGTNLRNIFLTLESSADKNLRPSVVGLSQAVENLAAKHMNATEMTKMFGKESVTAALALVSEKDKFVELTGVITDTNTAFEQQRINNDNVAGSVKGLQSAWEGLILTVNNSNGILKTSIDMFTSLITKAKEWFMTEEQLRKMRSSENVPSVVLESNQRINKSVAGGMTMEQALSEELKRANELYPEANSYQVRLEALSRRQAEYERAKLLNVNGYAKKEAEAVGEARKLLEISQKEYTERQAIYDNIKAQREEMVVIAAKQKELNINGTIQKPLKEAESPIGSLAELDKKINEAQKKYANAASDEARQAAAKTLDELKKRKITIEFQARFPNAPDFVNKGEGRGNLLSYAKISEKMPQKINPITREDIKLNNDFADSLSAIGSAFGSMSSMADGAAGSLLSYFSNLLTSVAAAIPAIDALNTKKKEESVANTEAAVTGAASSVASIPFVGAALAVAAIASVLAALANIPKYATGGIVGGSSFFGDHMIARVNSGEMILNQSQQGKLFDMINNGGPSNHITVDGEARVSGKAMYITIRNYMKANNIKW
ncbi:MAG: minor tail protein [Bacteriophage sp.]|nr:MAG: minor tail protein [Bacteriophage sp.]